MSSAVKFLELFESEVLKSKNLKPGSFICCKDSSNMYMVPTSGGTPVKMAETTLFLTNESRNNILAPINGKKYFCYDTGKMWVYYNDWVCINPSVASEIDVENVVVPKTGSVTVKDDRISPTSIGYFVPNLTFADLITDISVTCDNGIAIISAKTNYDIPGVLKVHAPVNKEESAKIASTLIVLTDLARTTLSDPIKDKIYFCYDTGKMWVYYNDWVCINPTSGSGGGSSGPVRASDLEDYDTLALKTDVPKNINQLTGYNNLATKDSVPKAASELTDYNTLALKSQTATKSEIPKNINQLTGYDTLATKDSVPTAASELSDYKTLALKSQTALKSDIPSKASQLTDYSTLALKSQTALKTDIPKAASDLSDYNTLALKSEVPKAASELSDYSDLALKSDLDLKVDKQIGTSSDNGKFLRVGKNGQVVLGNKR